MKPIKKYRRCHASDWLRSERLKKTWLALHYMGEKGATSLQIHEFTKSMSVHSDISELRANGINIPPAKYAYTNQNGRKVYIYKLISE